MCVCVCDPVGPSRDPEATWRKHERSAGTGAHLAAFLPRTALTGRGGRRAVWLPTSSAEPQQPRPADLLPEHYASRPSTSGSAWTIFPPARSRTARKIAFCGCIGEKARLEAKLQDMMSEKETIRTGRLHVPSAPVTPRSSVHGRKRVTRCPVRCSTGLAASERRLAGASSAVRTGCAATEPRLVRPRTPAVSRPAPAPEQGSILR